MYLKLSELGIRQKEREKEKEEGREKEREREGDRKTEMLFEEGMYTVTRGKTQGCNLDAFSIHSESLSLYCAI